MEPKDGLTSRSSVDRSDVGTCTIDVASRRIIACDAAFLQLTRATSAAETNFTDWVIHLVWAVEEMVLTMREGEVAHRVLHLVAERDATPPTRMHITVTSIGPADEDSVTCSVRLEPGMPARQPAPRSPLMR